MQSKEMVFQKHVILCNSHFEIRFKMMKKFFPLAAFVYLIAGCTGESVSIPLPVTYEPVRKSERQMTLSMSVAKNKNEDIKTGFSIFFYPTAPAQNFGMPIIYTASQAGGVFR